MAAIEVACPQCRHRFDIPEEAMDAPPGKVTNIRCPKCQARDTAASFLRVRERIEHERTESLRRLETKRLADEAAAKRDAEAREAERRRAAQVKRDEEERERTRLLDAKERLAALEREIAGYRINCDVCGRLCSRIAVRCPGCGHPVAPVEAPAIEHSEVRSVCSALRVMSAMAILAGIICGVVGLGGCKENKSYGPELLAAAVGGVWTGCIGIAVAGMWQTLERIARK